jgi:hypothetical protein
VRSNVRELASTYPPMIPPRTPRPRAAPGPPGQLALAV